MQHAVNHRFTVEATVDGVTIRCGCGLIDSAGSLDRVCLIFSGVDVVNNDNFVVTQLPNEGMLDVGAMELCVNTFMYNVSDAWQRRIRYALPTLTVKFNEAARAAVANNAGL